MQIDSSGLNILKGLEKCALKAYWDVNGWAIAYGNHVPGLTAKSTCTVDEAEEYLQNACESVSNSLSNLIKVKLSQGQFNALVIFAYNIGLSAFENSTLLSRLNAGNFACVPSELRRWNKSGGKVCPALVARREKEIEIWNGTETTQETSQEKENTSCE